MPDTVTSTGSGTDVRVGEAVAVLMSVGVAAAACFAIPEINNITTMIDTQLMANRRIKYPLIANILIVWIHEPTAEVYPR